MIAWVLKKILAVNPKTILIVLIGLILMASVLYVRGAIKSYGEAQYALGVEAERAEWASEVRARDLKIGALQRSIFASGQALSAARLAAGAELRAVTKAANLELSTRNTQISILKGRINENPPIQTLASAECVPARRLRLHAGANAQLARHRDTHRDAAGSSGTGSPAALVPAGRPTVVVKPDRAEGVRPDCDLTLADAEDRAVRLSVALAATEARYIALWSYVQSKYAAEVTIWNAEQARRADVERHVAKVTAP